MESCNLYKNRIDNGGLHLKEMKEAKDDAHQIRTMTMTNHPRMVGGLQLSSWLIYPLRRNCNGHPERANYIIILVLCDASNQVGTNSYFKPSVHSTGD